MRGTSTPLSRVRQIGPRLVLLLAAVLVVAGLPGGTLALQEEEHAFTGYRTYEQVTTMLQTMADHHTIMGPALPNIPWEERPAGCNDVV